MASPPPCPHLRLYRNGSSTPFHSFHLCLRSKPPGGRAELRRDPDEVRRCHSCGLAGPRLLACLACAALSCRLHAPDHSSSHAPSHAISVDVDRAELFCCACGDQVYDPEFDAAVVLAQTKSSSSSVSADAEGAIRKRRRVKYRPWSPTPREQQVIKWGSSPLWFSDAAASASGPSVPWGLRGLNNLGSTCFMNSVLQAMLHAPPLRNYFLSDKHNPYLCRQRRGTRKADVDGNSHCHQLGSGGYRDNCAAAAGTGKLGGSDAEQGKVLCLVCDLDAIYSAVFSGSRTPYSPAKFLYSWWQHASNLASYEQQDAHEFFISMLDGIHEKLGGDPKKPHSQGSGDCCIAHRVFSGILRSDVTCTVCGFTSTTYDPCIDISLNLDSAQHPSRMPSKSYSISDDKDPGVHNNGSSTLVKCLEHFTRPERLGSDQKLFCQQCQTRQESLKQMSIRKLPLVTCFHIKRFEHSSSRKISRKVDRYLQFPFSLDMGPYLSSSIMRSRFGNRIFTFNTADDEPNAPTSSEFELFAVITHSGRLESGHYTTFLRFSSQWYKCDDAWITQVGETVVRAAQAYMLFYVQKVLYYKANESA